MKKVLILANSDVGLYNFRKELIAELFKQGYEVYISLPNGRNIEKLIKMGCIFLETDVDRRGTNPIKDGQLFLNYIKLIKKVQPTVILTYTVKPNLYGGIASKICKVPYICNVTGLGSGFLNGGVIQKIIKIMSTVSFKHAKRVMVQNSSDMEQLINNNITKENITLIPGSGVNLDEFQPLPFPNLEVPLEFLFIARVMKDKGIDEFLEAAKKIKKKYENVNFNIIGSIEQEKYISILKEYEDKGIIKYHGFQRDIKSFILKSHCTINPSYTEGMSNVLLESAACGRPLIASDIPGCKEVIKDGSNGYIFTKANVEDLVRKIERFINLKYHEKNEMAFNSRKIVKENFDRKVVISLYMAEIERDRML